MAGSYLGPSYSEKEIGDALLDFREQLSTSIFQQLKFGEEEELCRYVADLISRGKVIAWFQGRMEWGSRALGNRSILGDPRRSDMREILNKKIITDNQ